MRDENRYTTRAVVIAVASMPLIGIAAVMLLGTGVVTVLVWIAAVAFVGAVGIALARLFERRHRA